MALEAAEFYYQASKSHTRFQSAESDSEELVLEDFHKPQARVVQDFMTSPDQILVMGGISGIGKSFFMKGMYNRGEADVVDFHALGGIKRTDDTKVVAEKILTERYELREKAKLLIMDEGLSGLVIPETCLTKPQRQALTQLLETYPQIIILGGGTHYTSDEQTNMIESTLPGELSVRAHPYPLKQLSTRQTADLAQRAPRAPRGIYQSSEERLAEVQLLNRELAELIAGTILPHFRLPRVVIRISNDLAQDTFPHLNEKSALGRDIEKYSLTPPEVFTRAWAVQRERIEANRDTIESLK